jgi:hypothetical protein
MKNRDVRGQRSTVLLAFIFTLTQLEAAHAQLPSPGSSPKAAGSEFFVGAEMGKPLVTVHLLNGVRTPGVYHVPVETNLAELIAFAGGATDQADLSGVRIRRASPEISLLEVDLVKDMKLARSLLPVQDQDIVHIETKVTPERTLTWISILSSIASVVLSIALINDIRNRN